MVHRLRPGRVHIIRKIAVGAEHPTAARPIHRGVEMNHLPKCVHTGVGSTGAGHFDGLIRHRGERILDDALHADTIPLTLPTIVGRAVILDAERYAMDFLIGAYA